MNKKILKKPSIKAKAIRQASRELIPLSRATEVRATTKRAETRLMIGQPYFCQNSQSLLMRRAING